MKRESHTGGVLRQGVMQDGCKDRGSCKRGVKTMVMQEGFEDTGHAGGV